MGVATFISMRRSAGRVELFNPAELKEQTK
jgi:hypothetical protein